MCLPAAVEPVNEIARTCGDSVIVGADVGAALPVMKFSTPLGRPLRDERLAPADSR